MVLQLDKMFGEGRVRLHFFFQILMRDSSTVGRYENSFIHQTFSESSQKLKPNEKSLKKIVNAYK